MADNAASLPQVLVFGGTSEGRELVEWLSAQGFCRVVVCCATEYGAELVSGLPRVKAQVGPLDEQGKRRLVAECDFARIVDATHPYATHVTQSVAKLAAEFAIPLTRLVRPDDRAGKAEPFADARSAAAYVAARQGNVLLTTGTKDLETFVCAMPDFAERLYVRLLPVVDSLAHARELGMPASHIIAMQGPFSVQMNRAFLRELSIGVMVTKASGAAGGFAEKLEAAEAEGVEVAVIGRPSAEAGLTLKQTEAELAAAFGARAAAQAASTGKRQRVWLVAAGMGDGGTLTAKARFAIESSELLVGSARLLDAFSSQPCEKRVLVKSDEIVCAIEEAKADRISVLFSGDVGFYSGARLLVEKLDANRFAIEAIPGVSSVAYLCAKLLIAWQDVHLVSAHGRACDPVDEVRGHAKVFFLTGGSLTAGGICAALSEAGLGDVRVCVGERLSYADERIVKARASELAGASFEDLSVILVENPDAPRDADLRRKEI